MVSPQWWGANWDDHLLPRPIKAISHQAFLRVRPATLENMLVKEDAENWSQPKIQKEMQEWINDMTPTKFQSGCVVEIFLWVYSLYMLAGPGGCWEEEWCNVAISETELWFSETMSVCRLKYNLVWSVHALICSFFPETLILRIDGLMIFKIMRVLLN